VPVGAPVALTLEADRPVITADGADLSRIIVTAVDQAQGQVARDRRTGPQVGQLCRAR